MAETGTIAYRWLIAGEFRAFPMRFVLAGLAIAARLSVVTPGAEFRFPRDHGAHSAYRTEWWYFTGWLEAPDGRPIGIQITFFPLAPRD